MYSDEVWNKSIAISKQILEDNRKRNELCIAVIMELIEKVWPGFDANDTAINNILNFQADGGEVVRLEDPLIMRGSGDICYQVRYGDSYFRRIFSADWI